MPKGTNRSGRILSCGLVFPRTTVWIIISIILLLVNLIICLLSLCEFTEPSAWRWVGCGFDFFFVLAYFILLVFNIREVRHRVYKNKHEFDVRGAKYANAVEMRHSAMGFIWFFFVSIFWAIFMGIKTDSQFLITTNVTNYFILKFFYSLNVIATLWLVAFYFDYPSDFLDLRQTAIQK